MSVRSGRTTRNGINAVYNHYIRETPITFDIEEWDLSSREAWIHSHTGGRHQVLVAVDDDRVVGYASTGPWRPKAAYERSVETSIYIAPGHLHAAIRARALRRAVRRGRRARHPPLSRGRDDAERRLGRDTRGLRLPSGRLLHRAGLQVRPLLGRRLVRTRRASLKGAIRTSETPDNGEATVTLGDGQGQAERVAQHFARDGLGDRALAEDAAVFHHQRVREPRRHLLEVMGHQHDRRTRRVRVPRLPGRRPALPGRRRRALQSVRRVARCRVRSSVSRASSTRCRSPADSVGKRWSASGPHRHSRSSWAPVRGPRRCIDATTARARRNARSSRLRWPSSTVRVARRAPAKRTRCVRAMCERRCARGADRARRRSRSKGAGTARPRAEASSCPRRSRRGSPSALRARSPSRCQRGSARRR